MRRPLAMLVLTLAVMMAAIPAYATDTPAQDQSISDVDHRSDRAVDRVVDRRHCVDRVTDRFCLDDRHPHDVDIRHLLHRLFHAGEWEKLFGLLHRLHLI